MRISDARRHIRVYMSEDIPVFLKGKPGVGKSDLVHQIAHTAKPKYKETQNFIEKGIPLIDFRALLRDPVDLRGVPAIDHEHKVACWLPPSDLPNALRHGPEGILFMDELNAAPNAVQAACFSLVLDRRVGEYILPPGWYIIAAGNNLSDRAAAQRMNNGLANRFAHLEVEEHVDDFADWANKNDLAPEVVAFLRFMPKALHIMPKGDEPSFPTPRSWARVSRILQHPSASDVTLRASLTRGLVGEGAAIELEGFLRIYQKLPDFDDVLKNPKRAPIPKDDIASMYAITTGLARKVTAKNLGAALTYIERSSKEYETLLVWDVRKRGVDLRSSREFTDWVNANQDVIFGD